MEHNILETGPKMLKGFIKRDWHAHIARQAMRSFAATHAGSEHPVSASAVSGAASKTNRGTSRPTALFTCIEQGDRVDMYHATSMLRSKKAGLPEDEATIVETFLLDGIWTKTRLHEAGYDVDDTLCPLCGVEDDTLDHRLFRCCHGDFEARRKEHLHHKTRLWLDSSRNTRMDPDNRHREESARLLARRGLTRHPALHQPPPAAEGADFFGDTDEAFSCGIAFSDGSCTRPFHPALARASWAAGAIDNDGNLIGVAHGPVWRNLPQTSPTAEVVGMAAVAQLIPQGTAALTMHIDNSMVVRTLNHPPGDRHLHHSYHAGVLRTARAHPGWKAMTGKARHIKSHLYDERPDDLARLPAMDQHRYKGNMAIDDEADKANDVWHKPLVKDIVAIDHMAFRAAQQVCRLAGAILPQFPLMRHQGLYRRRAAAVPAPTIGPFGEAAAAQFQTKLARLEDLAYGITASAAADDIAAQADLDQQFAIGGAGDTTHLQAVRAKASPTSTVANLVRAGREALERVAQQDGDRHSPLRPRQPESRHHPLLQCVHRDHRVQLSRENKRSYRDVCFDPAGNEGAYGQGPSCPGDCAVEMDSVQEEIITARFPHEWVSSGICTWRCTQCGVMASACPSRPSGGACTGLPKAVAKPPGKGHTLWRFEPTPGSPFAAYVCCQSCGASGSQMTWQHLSGPCLGKWTSASTKLAWQRLNSGKHPHQRHKAKNLFFPGVPLPQRQALAEEGVLQLMPART